MRSRRRRNGNHGAGDQDPASRLYSSNNPLMRIFLSPGDVSGPLKVGLSLGQIIPDLVDFAYAIEGSDLRSPIHTSLGMDQSPFKVGHSLGQIALVLVDFGQVVQASRGLGRLLPFLSQG